MTACRGALLVAAARAASARRACSIRRSASARCRPSISSSTFTRAKTGWRSAWRVIAEETWRALERPLGVDAAALHARRARRSDRAVPTATPRRCPTTPIVIYAVCAVGLRAQTSTTGCGWCSRTSSRTSSTSIARKAGRESCARSSDGRRSRFRTCSCRTWQIEGLATYEESAITGEGRLHAGDFLRDRRRGARERRARAARPRQRRPDRLARRRRCMRLRRRLSSYLADRFGAGDARGARRGDGADASPTPRRPPSSSLRRVARRACGASIRRASSRGRRGAGAGIDAGITRLTRQGSRCAVRDSIASRAPGCPAEIVYSASNPRRLSRRSYRVGLDGGRAAAA